MAFGKFPWRSCKRAMLISEARSFGEALRAFSYCACASSNLPCVSYIRPAAMKTSGPTGLCLLSSDVGSSPASGLLCQLKAEPTAAVDFFQVDDSTFSLPDVGDL